MIAQLIFTVLLSCLGASDAKLGFNYTDVVETKYGKVQGFRLDAEQYGIVDFYEGIRFGQAGRFEKPHPPAKWEGVYNASRYNFACAQKAYKYAEHLGHSNGIETGQSNEDCLFLNLWRPTKPSNEKRPVMVFFYGGAYTFGTIFLNLYDGRYMSAIGDAVVILANYRLGAFGFMYGGSKDFNGNMGLYDMKLTLEWVQENIHKFGGDRSRVTIFGESAGSMSVSALVLSPLTKGLFNRAILQSGSTNSFYGSSNLKSSIDKTRTLAEAFECKDTSPEGAIACLRTKKAEDIIRVESETMAIDERFSPAFETEFLPHKPTTALMEGHFNKVDMIFGVVDDEGSAFIERFHPMFQPHADAHQLTKEMATKFCKVMCTIAHEHYCSEVGDHYAKFMNETDKNQMRHIIAESFGDYHITCPTILFGREAQKKAPENKFYTYRLMKKMAMDTMGSCSGWAGVCHARDLEFIFGIPIRSRGFLAMEWEYELSVSMIKAWTNFARTGNPGKIGQVIWEEANNNKEIGAHPYTNVMMLDPANYRMQQVYKETCDTFWRQKLGFY